MSQSATDFESYLQVYAAPDGNRLFNLLRTFHIDLDSIDDVKFTNYHIRQNDTWTRIAFEHYQSIDLWWLLILVNRDVIKSNPVRLPANGVKLRIPTSELVRLIIGELRDHASKQTL